MREGHVRRLKLETLAVLPGLGLLGCATASATINSDIRLAEAAAPTLDDWREHAPDLDPMSSADAAQLSSELALAAGDYGAAKAHIEVALDYAPHLEGLQLGRVEAHLALGELETARGLLDDLDPNIGEPSSSLTQVRLDIHEAERDQGEASCSAALRDERTALEPHDDYLSVWNELRAQLPADAVSTIPTTDAEARVELCVDDCEGEINVLRLDGENESILALAFGTTSDEGRGLLLVPELVRAETASCEDETTVGIELVGEHVRVRAYSNTRQPPQTEDWRLGLEAELGRIATQVQAQSASSGYYAAASSGYASSGHGSSGYASSGSSGYASSGYAYYGCGGGYDYDYDYAYYCQVSHGVERDLFIDLERGEVVLDIVRTGPADAAMGRVEVDDHRVGVQACGLDQTLELSWTA